MRRWSEPLPKKVFYEDNLMVCKTMPHIKRMYYMPSDLYRYWIGRPDQSVQENVSKKRYTHHILVAESCFKSVKLDEIAEPMLKRYLRHELFMLFGITTMFTRLNKSEETDRDLEAMWQSCKAHDKKWGTHFRNLSPLAIINIPGKIGQLITTTFYRLANKVVRFN